MKVIDIKNAAKKYKIYHERPMLVKSLFTSLARGKKIEEFWALKNVNIEVNKGEAAGIIGDNGAGKSTMLKILSGVTMPTQGTVRVAGRIAGLLELGAGFHPDLTGRENVFLNGSILGLTKKEIEAKFDSIVEYAGIKDFIDTPLRNYSSGMFVRLGFAVAIHVNPEILLVDEVLAVGDQSFQAKCLKTIENFLEDGNTLVFVSHDLNIIRHICTRVVLLEKGQVVLEGEPSKVISRYWLSIGDKKGIGKIERGDLKVVFNNGRLILLWKDIELTKGLSGYTSMRSFVKWYDSSVAEWLITENTGDIISARGEWIGLPLSQQWTIKFYERFIEWEVKMEVKSPVDILKQQANLMLSEDYNRWFAEGEYSGDFPKFRDETDDDWDSIWTAENPSRWIGVHGEDKKRSPLPAVKFYSKPFTGKEKVNIVNSNTYYRGRVLQQLRENDEVTKRYEAGTHSYFSGRIKVE